MTEPANSNRLEPVAVSGGERPSLQLEPGVAPRHEQSAIEELRASNEELSRTNAALQKAYEEIRVLNEELHKRNVRIEARENELERINDDLVNMLAATGIPVVMTDRDFRIRRYTIAEPLLGLTHEDVGRSASILASRVAMPDIENILKRMAESRNPCEEEVAVPEGSTYLLRCRPYVTGDKKVNGAVFHFLDTTRLKNNLDRVHRSLAYAEAIFDTIHEPLAVLDGNLKIRDANRAFHACVDLPPGAALGSGIKTIAGGVFDVPAVRALEELVSGEGQLDGVEFEFRRADGEERVFLLNGRRFKSSENDWLILVAFDDITEQKRSAEARYRLLFESARDGIAVVNAETGEIIDINPFLETLLGYSKADCVGRRLWDMEVLNSNAEARAAFSRILTENVLHFEDVPVRVRNGRILRTDVVANVCPDKNRRLIQLNVRDVTERRQFEYRLRQTQKLEILGRLAGGIAHDFNNLLTGMLGNASLGLLGLPPGDPARRNFHEIEAAAEKASLLTRRMLAYAGRGQFAVRRVSLTYVIRNISAVIRDAVPRTAELDLKLGDGLPPVDVDVSQMEHAIMDLVVNAAEAIGENQPGRIELVVSRRSLSRKEALESFSVERLVPGEYVQIEVSDNGVGMDETTQARIFDPFFSTKFAGRGLGLAATLGIVRSHGGAIRVRSTLGRGSSFTVLLSAAGKPVALPPGTVILMAGADAPSDGHPSLTLSQLGCRVLRAADGIQCIDLFREHNGIISAVMLESPLPAADDVDVIRQLRSIRAEIPIVVYSKLEEGEVLERLRRHSPDAYLHSPSGRQDLLKTFSSLIDPHRKP